MIVVVTGADGLVGGRLCAALVKRGVQVRAVVRRPATAASLPAVMEVAGDVADAGVASSSLAGADAAATTVHPMGSDAAVQRWVGVEGTTAFARAAAAAGVERLVHVSTAAVRGLTRVLLRPPAVLGPGESSIWNSVQPAAVRDREGVRHAVPEQTFAWVHADDLVALAADVATARIVAADDPARGPVAGGCTAVDVAAGAATARDYYETVARAVGVTPVWDDGPAWTGRILAERARSWGWAPKVGQAEALEEVERGLR